MHVETISEVARSRSDRSRCTAQGSGCRLESIVLGQRSGTVAPVVSSRASCTPVTALTTD